jgi:serine/threonine protein kinase
MSFVDDHSVKRKLAELASTTTTRLYLPTRTPAPDLDASRFETLLAKASLLSPDELKAHLQRLPFSSAVSLQHYLVSSGRLSEWQIVQLSKGKWRLTFDHLELKDHISTGTRCTVYKVIRRNGDMSALALKITGRRYSDEALVKQLYIKISRSISAQRSPNLIRTFEYGDHKGRFYAVQELVNGVGIGDIVEHFGRPKDAILLYIARTLAILVQTCHSNGCTLGGVETDNVLIGNDGSIRVIAPSIAAIERLEQLEGGNTTCFQSNQYLQHEDVHGLVRTIRFLLGYGMDPRNWSGEIARLYSRLEPGRADRLTAENVWDLLCHCG